MLRLVLPARIPSLEGEAIGRVRELRAIVHAQRGSSSIVSPFLPFSDTTSLPLPFRRGYTSPSFHPATPFPLLSYLSARIPTGFSSTPTWKEGKGCIRGQRDGGFDWFEAESEFLSTGVHVSPSAILFFFLFSRAVRKYGAIGAAHLKLCDFVYPEDFIPL